MAKQLDIVYEDDHLVAVNKPSGLLTIPDRFKHDLPNLYTMLQKDRDELFIVHRLDRFTSGGLIFAKSAEVHKTLSQMFTERIPEKYYLAICDGVPNKHEGTIDAALAESMTTRGKMIVHRRGKPSMSEYKVLEDFGKYSLIQVQIFSGRLHQVRVHLSHIGVPLIVDNLYGKREEFFLSEIKGRKYRLAKYEEERPILTRQPLHAWKLVLPHPAEEKKLELEFELPKDMRAILNQMRKLSKDKY